MLRLIKDILIGFIICLFIMIGTQLIYIWAIELLISTM